MQQDWAEASDETGPSLFPRDRVRRLQEIQEFLRRSGHGRGPARKRSYVRSLPGYSAKLAPSASGASNFLTVTDADWRSG